MSHAFEESMRQVIDEQTNIFSDLEYVEVIDNVMKNIKK